MTASGYSKENAVRLIAMVIRGEIGVEKAIAEVAGDLNQSQRMAATTQTAMNSLTLLLQAETATGPHGTMATTFTPTNEEERTRPRTSLIHRGTTVSTFMEWNSN